MKKLQRVVSYCRGFSAKHFSIQKFVNIFFLLITSCLIILSIISYKNDEKFKDTSFWIKHTQTVLETSKKIALLTKDAQMYSGSYILKRDTNNIITYKNAIKELPEEIQALKNLSTRHSEQRHRIDTLHHYINKLIILTNKAYLVPRPKEEDEVAKLLDINTRRFLQQKIDRTIYDIENNETQILRVKEEVNSSSIAISNKISYGLLAGIITLIITSVFSIAYYFKKKKIAEENLFESEERYRSLVNNIGGYAIYLMDCEGKILNWNLGAQLIKGYTAEEITGKFLSVFYMPEDKEKGLPEDTLRNAAKHGKYSTEGWRVRKDGTQFWANVFITALYDSKGKLRGFTKVTRDDTIRKNAENEAFKALEREKELNEMKSNFLSMASHEFKTPLGIIVASTILLGKFKTTEQQEERNRIIKKIILSAKNLNAIIDGFLSVQKLDEGITEKYFQNISLVSHIEKLCKQLKEISKAGQSIIHTHSGEEIIRTDEFILQQILTNLISNAIKYSPEGATIEVAAKTSNEQFTITIKDNGIGISEKDQVHLFERFYRASNTVGVTGTGLGLYIVKKQVEALNGIITFKSILGKGSEFSIVINQNLHQKNPEDLNFLSLHDANSSVGLNSFTEK